jgi:DNA-binding transcriptional regulator GbsR (MarR family)
MSVRSNAAPADRLDGLTGARQRLVDDFGQLLARYGTALTLGRVFALLLLSDAPLSLDEIAAQLEVSKSGVSVATRDLERLGIARRLGRPGSRRVLYESMDDMLPIFEAQFNRIRQQLSLVQRADALVPRGRAKERLREMTALHEFWLAESEGIMARWRRRSKG